MALGARSTSLANLIQAGSSRPLALIAPRSGFQLDPLSTQGEQNPGSGIVKRKITEKGIEAFKGTKAGKAVSKTVGKAKELIGLGITGKALAGSTTGPTTGPVTNPPATPAELQQLFLAPGVEAAATGAAGIEGATGAAATGAAATGAASSAGIEAAVAGTAVAAGAPAAAAAGTAAAEAAGLAAFFCMGAAQYYPLGSSDWIQTRWWLKEGWTGPLANLFRHWYSQHNIWLGSQISKRPVLKSTLRPFFKWAHLKGSTCKEDLG